MQKTALYTPSWVQRVTMSSRRNEGELWACAMTAGTCCGRESSAAGRVSPALVRVDSPEHMTHLRARHPILHRRRLPRRCAGRAVVRRSSSMKARSQHQDERARDCISRSHRHQPVHGCGRSGHPGDLHEPSDLIQARDPPAFIERRTARQVFVDATASAGRRWSLRTARVCARALLCRSPWTGTSWMTFPPADFTILTAVRLLGIRPLGNRMPPPQPTQPPSCSRRQSHPGRSCPGHARGKTRAREDVTTVGHHGDRAYLQVVHDRGPPLPSFRPRPAAFRYSRTVARRGLAHAQLPSSIERVPRELLGILRRDRRRVREPHRCRTDEFSAGRSRRKRVSTPPA